MSYSRLHLYPWAPRPSRGIDRLLRWARSEDPVWVRSPRTGKAHLADGCVPILDPEFDWRDETWVSFHLETHTSIGTDPYESRALFEPENSK
jgi:hypothetical protein